MAAIKKSKHKTSSSNNTKTREDFIMNEIRVFLTKHLHDHELKAAMKTIVLTRNKNDEFTAALHKGCTKHEAFIDKRDANKKISIHSFMNRNNNLFEDDVGPKTYRKITNWLEKTSNGTISSIAYNNITGQSILTVCLNKNKPLKKQLQIIKFIPYIKPVNGIKTVNIHEPSCGEHGSYDLTINKNSKCEIIVGYGQQTSIFNGSLMECLQYIYQNLANDC